MVAAPTRPAVVNYDRLARPYFQALGRGQQPDQRPDLGPEWSPVADILESTYRKAHGNSDAMASALSSLERKFPALADLLAPPPVLESEPVEDDLGIPLLPEHVQLPALLSRGACPELDWYIDFSREASPEGYEEFHAFCGLWLFSTVAARRVSLKIKRKRFYTNLMIALFAETSMFAKSFTVQQAIDVLYELNLYYLLGPNRITPAKLFSNMAGNIVPEQYNTLSPGKQELARRKLATAAQKGLIFDEFGKFVQGMLRKSSTNAEFVDMFLEFDACPPHYENATVSRGGEPIEKPYITLIGNIVPPNLKENAQAGADFWTDGFWARFSFVVAPPATPDNIGGDEEDDDDEDEEIPIPQNLLMSLRKWHERLGIPDCHPEPILDKKNEPTGHYVIERDELPDNACTISPEARKAWKRYRIALKRMCLKFPHQDFHGSYTRLPETAMRMAVLMASLSNNGHVEIRHWAKAQELAEILRRNLHELYARVNTPSTVESQAARIENEIARHLKRVGPMPLNKLRTSYMKKYSTKQLEETLRSMKRAGMVEEFQTSHCVKYKLIERKDDDDDNYEEWEATEPEATTQVFRSDELLAIEPL